MIYHLKVILSMIKALKDRECRLRDLYWARDQGVSQILLMHLITKIHLMHLKHLMHLLEMHPMHQMHLFKMHLMHQMHLMHLFKMLLIHQMHLHAQMLLINSAMKLSPNIHPIPINPKTIKDIHLSP